jgi:hypothetical protein
LHAICCRTGGVTSDCGVICDCGGVGDIDCAIRRIVVVNNQIHEQEETQDDDGDSDSKLDDALACLIASLRALRLGATYRTVGFLA